MLINAVQVNILVWYPANLAVNVDDPVLNLIIPSASLAAVSSPCSTALYQRTAVYATCDFVGGGANPITGVDVSSLVAFSIPSSRTSAVVVNNNYVQVAVPVLSTYNVSHVA